MFGRYFPSNRVRRRTRSAIWALAFLIALTAAERSIAKREDDGGDHGAGCRIKVEGIAKGYLEAEYQHVRGFSIEASLNEQGRLTEYAAIGSALAWTWLATNPWNPAYPIVCWLPAVFTALCGIRVIGLAAQVARASHYVRQLEVCFGTPPMGWEHYVGSHRMADYVYNGTSVVFFVGLLAGNVFLARRARALLGHTAVAPGDPGSLRSGV